MVPVRLEVGEESPLWQGLLCSRTEVWGQEHQSHHHLSSSICATGFSGTRPSALSLCKKQTCIWCLVLEHHSPQDVKSLYPETERGNLYKKSRNVPWCKANGHPCSELCRLPAVLLLILASEGSVQVLGSPPDDLFSVNTVCFFLSYSVPSVLPFH